MQTAQHKLAPGSSRGPRSRITLLRQMESDLQRGERIKELRNTRRFTQPAMAEAVHVSLRAYQEWEYGGGIDWENLKALATKLGTTPDFILSGSEKGLTPDLSNGQNPDVDRLERMEQDIADIKATTTALQGAVLAMTGELLHLRRELAGRAEEGPSQERREDES